MSKMIAVCVSTGMQGGAVVDNLLRSGCFKVRGLTRNSNSPDANALKERGKELVAANFDDQASLETAFSGCYGALFFTNYWMLLSPARELEQGRNLANAAHAADLKHLVWSTFEDTREYKDDIPLMEGGYKVPHFDAKDEVAKHIKIIGLNATYLFTSFYMDIFIGEMKFKPDEEGVHRLYLPMKDKRLPIVLVNDIGQMAAVALEKQVTGDLRSHQSTWVKKK